MNLSHLAIFMGVAEAGSVTRGAERMMISQPAVSKQLKIFERSLGTVLFDRLPDGLQLTAAGEVLLVHARKLFAVEAEATRALSELRGLSRGRLSIGASMTIGVYLLPWLLQVFKTNHPAIELHVEIGNTAAIQEKLLRHEIDLAMTEGMVESASLRADVFGTDELVLIVPRGHRLLNEMQVLAAHVAAEPLILRERGSGTREVVERAFAQRGITLTPPFSLANTEAIKQSVLAGLGIAILSRLTVEWEMRDGKLVEVPIADLGIRRPLHFVEHMERTTSVSATAFRNQVIGVLSGGQR